MVVLICLSALIAALSTHELSLKKNWGTIRSSSFLTLVFVFLTMILSIEPALKLQMAFLGGSFVGMTDPKRLSRIQIICAGLVFSLLFLKLIQFLGGLGGALGLSALLSCLMVNLVFHSGKKVKTILRKRSKRNLN